MSEDIFGELRVGFGDLEDPPPANEHELAETAFTKAQQLIKRAGSHPAMGVFQLPRRYVLLNIQQHMATDDAKDTIVELLHGIAHKLKPLGFVYIGEIWRSELPKPVPLGVSPESALKELLEKHGMGELKKTECIMVHAQTQTGERVVIGDIIRGTAGEVVEVVRDVAFNDPTMTATGMFSGIISRGSA